MKPLPLLCLTLGACLLAAAPACAFAAEATPAVVRCELLDLLVQKGVLTTAETDELATPTAPAASWLSKQESTCPCSRNWSSLRTSGAALNDFLFVLFGNEFRLVKTVEIGSETLTVSIIGLGYLLGSTSVPDAP